MEPTVTITFKEYQELNKIKQAMEDETVTIRQYVDIFNKGLGLEVVPKDQAMHDMSTANYLLQSQLRKLMQDNKDLTEKLSKKRKWWWF